MDKKEKLFRKINKKDRIILKFIIESLETNQKSKLNITKLKGVDFYKVRKGRFRIIFHYELNNLIIDSIKLRNEKTYKNV